MYFSEDDSYCPLDRFAIPAHCLQDAIGDLALQFGQHSLQASHQKSASEEHVPVSPFHQAFSPNGANNTSIPPCLLDGTSSLSSTRSNSIAWSDVSSASSSPVARPTSILPTAPTPSYHRTNVRQQRQRDIRRMCSASHLQEISELVERMVRESDQCVLCDPSTADESAIVEEEEDIRPQSSCADADVLAFTRAASFGSRSSAACVSKNVRLRKPRRRRTAMST